MRFLIQVVDRASVTVAQENYEAAIGAGVLVYVGIHKDDVADYSTKIAHFVSKIRSLQVLHRDGKIIGTLEQTDGELLLISNFTLYGENRKGNRFDFGDSAGFEDAKKIYDELLLALQHSGIRAKGGVFGGYMKVESVCDGPINVLMEV